jgi:NAD(P)-dependent dehydrogenase (short-subunit alcohol dehydrogenase family)
VRCDVEPNPQFNPINNKTETAVNDRSVRKDLPLAMVVGACGGMGLACARRLGQRYRVVLADISADGVQRAAEQLGEEGIATLPVACDVTSDASVAALIATIQSEGTLQALAYVVGLSPACGNWRAIMAVNYVGAQRMADAVLPLMHGGAAVFISSLAAHAPGDFTALHALLDDPLQADYIAKLEAAEQQEITPQRSYMISKYGMNRMCRRLAREWGANGNRIVSLSPGLIATPMGEREFTASPQKWDLLKRTPLQRQGGLLEITDALDFLLSDRASFISGTDLLVDGGIAAANQFQ